MGVDVFLFLQVQAITFKVASLENQVRQQASETKEVSEQIGKEHDFTIRHMAGTFVLLTCLITTFHVTAHLRNFNLPDVQRKIISILWMPPIYGVASFLSLCFPAAHE